MGGQRYFLSYSRADSDEVELLDLELRRFGVPMWRDRSDLRLGRLVGSELEQAASAAAGFVFYLTERSMKSEWVREFELALARKQFGRRSDFVIFPIFRQPQTEIVKAMKALGENPDRDVYDLSPFAGYEFNSERLPYDLGGELRRAALGVLGAMQVSIANRLGAGEALEMALLTRDGPRPERAHLIVDWTFDYPPEGESDRRPPSAVDYKHLLAPTMASIKKSFRSVLRDRPLRLRPQCHLSMAFAFGFCFRRNVGVDIEVKAPNIQEIWSGPAVPENGDADAWTVERIAGTKDGRSMALAINVTRNRDEFRANLKKHLETSGVGVASTLYLEPAHGPCWRSLAGLEPLAVHRMAVAAVDLLCAEPIYHGCDAVHLFLAGPPGLAILLGQQLSNVRRVQVHEWLVGKEEYVPCFQLVSS